MSNFTNSTMNRGVEAKEVEIANARLDLEASESTQWTGVGGAGCAGDTPLSPAFTGSYLQVVVEKHKRRRDQHPAATSVRLPAASSPALAMPGPAAGTGAGDSGTPWPRGAVLLACPASLAYYLGGGAEGGDGSAPAQPAKTHKSWHVFRERASPPTEDALLQCNDDVWEECNGAAGEAGCGAAEPPCVEVYRFERVGAWLSCGAARPTRVGARAAIAGRAARRAAAEVGAAARLAAGAPSLAAVLVLRCALQTVRDAAAAALIALSDYGLKPALALTFNALLHPPLVFLANLLRGVRAALRPAVALVSECAGAAAVLLRAVRLVDLHFTYPAPSAAPPPPCACRATTDTHHCT